MSAGASCTPANARPRFAFYSELFGWTKGDAIDMGPMGIYQIFAIGGAPSGGMMTKTPEIPHPFWLYYFNVEGIDAAMARVKKAGGRILNGPIEVPGGTGSRSASTRRARCSR